MNTEEEFYLGNSSDDSEFFLGNSAEDFYLGNTAATSDEPASDGDEDYQDDYSKDFRFGFWRGGIFNGWPSGHTATATAMAVTLATLYPDNKYIFAGAIAYSAMIGVSMSFMAHWASDIFAGAITGFVIGRVVGKSFRNKQDGKEDRLSLYAYPGGAGMTLRF